MLRFARHSLIDLGGNQKAFCYSGSLLHLPDTRLALQNYSVNYKKNSNPMQILCELKVEFDFLRGWLRYSLEYFESLSAEEIVESRISTAVHDDHHQSQTVNHLVHHSRLDILNIEFLSTDLSDIHSATQIVSPSSSEKQQHLKHSAKRVPSRSLNSVATDLSVFVCYPL